MFSTRSVAGQADESAIGLAPSSRPSRYFAQSPAWSTSRHELSSCLDAVGTVLQNDRLQLLTAAPFPVLNASIDCFSAVIQP